jgi:general secretion pathway protein G
MIKFLTILLFLISAIEVYAGEKGIPAYTADGKRIILFINNTWKYDTSSQVLKNEIIYKGVYCKLLEAKIIDSHNGKQAGVRFKLQNRSNKIITSLSIKVFYLGKDGRAIFEQTFSVVYPASSYSINSHLISLKPNYIVNHLQKNSYYSIAKGLSLEDWVESKVRFKLVDLRFSDTEPLDRLSMARIKAAKAYIETFSTALEAYRLINGSYPTEKQGLIVLIQQKLLRSKKSLIDPWGREYIYRRTKTGFIIKTYGADGEPGGKGVNKDLSSE